MLKGSPPFCVKVVGSRLVLLIFINCCQLTTINGHNMTSNKFDGKASDPGSLVPIKKNDGSMIHHERTEPSSITDEPEMDDVDSWSEEEEEREESDVRSIFNTPVFPRDRHSKPPCPDGQVRVVGGGDDCVQKLLIKEVEYDSTLLVELTKKFYGKKSSTTQRRRHHHHHHPHDTRRSNSSNSSQRSKPRPRVGSPLGENAGTLIFPDN